jgi:UDP-N-acetylmuramoylalanine--D-glutamate ligase
MSLSAGRPPLAPGPFLVVGLARSGVAAALALRDRGETVIGCDVAAPDAGALRAAGVEVHLRDDGAALVERVRSVVKSPGVPQEAPAVMAARQRGRVVIGELELAWRLLANPWIAVTGTNGKTTTVELLGHLHREAGVAAAVAGNVGTPAASLAGRLPDDAVVVCEASSFQLEDTEAFAPEGAVLLNLAEDHLDRHGTMEAYLRAKLQVFARQGNDDVAVAPCDIGVEDLGGCARRLCFGQEPEAELSERSGQLWWAEEPLLPVSEIRLRGAHNVRNAMAAAAVALARGLPRDVVSDGLRSFRGVAHRLEEVGRRDGVLYVNDSKATNVASTRVALRSFDVPVHVILGGRGKGGGYRGLRDDVRAHAAAAYLIGEEAEALAADLDGLGVPLHRSADLERALAAARAAAAPGEVVLLSPAAASYDQFRDYEQRGERFRELTGGHVPPTPAPRP